MSYSSNDGKEEEFGMNKNKCNVSKHVRKRWFNDLSDRVHNPSNKHPYDRNEFKKYN